MQVEFLEPTSLSEATGLLARHGDKAKLIAGGASVALLLRHRIITPEVLVSLGRVPGYDAIRLETDGLHLGALARLSTVEHSPVVEAFCPALVHAYGVVGNVRVRNQGTVGGNLGEADYASDPPAMLLALNARVQTTRLDGTRTIPLSSLYTGFYSTALEPDEIMAEVVVPRLPESARAVYYKYTSRSEEARPSVAVAAVANLAADGSCREVRVAVGAAIATPRRLPEVEAQAVGEKLSDTLIQKIADGYAGGLEPIDDPMESAWYRTEMIRVFVRRALQEARDGHR